MPANKKRGFASIEVKPLSSLRVALAFMTTLAMLIGIQVPILTTLDHFGLILVALVLSTFTTCYALLIGYMIGMRKQELRQERRT